MGPVREVFFSEEEARVPHHQLVDRPIAQNVGELHGQLVGVLPSPRRPCRMVGVAGAERCGRLRHVQADHHPALRRDLVIEAGAADLLPGRALQRDVEPRVRRPPRLFFRLALVLVVREEMQPVAHDGSAKCRCVLLVLDGRHAMEDWIGRVEPIVAEIAPERPGVAVGARLGDQVDLEARGTALRRIESIGDELEFRDHLLAERRLAAAAHRVLKLLAVNVGLKLPNPVGVPRIDSRDRVARGAAPGRQQQQRAPVAPLEGHLLHLLLIDIAAEDRRRDIQEGCFRGDDDRFCQRRWRQLQVHHERLADEQLQSFTHDGGEALQFRLRSCMRQRAPGCGTHHGRR